MKDQLLNKVQNIVAKGEIAYNEQFLNLPNVISPVLQRSQKTSVY